MPLRTWQRTGPHKWSTNLVLQDFFSSRGLPGRALFWRSNASGQRRQRYFCHLTLYQQWFDIEIALVELLVCASDLLFGCDSVSECLFVWLDRGRSTMSVQSSREIIMISQKKNKQSFIKIDNRSSLSSFCYHRLQDVGWFTTWRHRLIISLLHRSLYISILKLKGKTLLHLGLQIWYWINNDFLLLLFPVVFLAFKSTSRCTWILLDIVAADLEIRVVEIS